MTQDSKTCPQCGATFEQNESFCQFDGTPLTSSAQLPQAPTHPQKPSFWKRVPRESLAGVFLVLVIGAVVATTMLYRQSQEFQVSVLFDEGHGLMVGDSVFVRGVAVGDVYTAGFSGDQFLAQLRIQSDAATLLREDSVYFIGYEKIATQKRCVDVLVLDPKSKPLENGQTVRGEDSMVRFLTQIAKTEGPKAAADLASELKSTLSGAVGDLGGFLPIGQSD